MKKPVWLDRAVCLAIHEMVLSQHGGLAGVRDEGLLESALEKPPNLLAYGSPTLAELAASYAAGIILNHPFIDGNKRTAFAAMYTFLAINKVQLTASAGETENFVLNLYLIGSFDFEHLCQWLRSNVSH